MLVSMVQIEISNQEEVLSDSVDLRNQTSNDGGFHLKKSSPPFPVDAGIQEKLREIILPVNGSPNDSKVLRYACELARSLSARVALVYIINPPEALHWSSDQSQNNTSLGK